MKKLSLSFILILLFFGCSSTPKETAPEQTAPQETASSSETDAATHLNRGNEHYRQNNFDQAVSEYGEALRKAPSMSEAYIARGNAYSGMLDLQKARDDYNAGARIDSGYDHYAKGYSHYINQDYRSAIDEFTQSIAQNSNIFAAYNDRGLAYANLGNANQAIADFDEAIKINSNSAFAYNNRGNANLAKANYDQAINDYSRAASLYPALVFPYSGRGLANFRKQEYDKAIEDYSRAISMTPRDSVLYSLRGDAYRAKGENQLAEEDYARAESLKK